MWSSKNFKNLFKGVLGELSHETKKNNDVSVKNDKYSKSNNDYEMSLNRCNVNVEYLPIPTKKVFDSPFDRALIIGNTRKYDFFLYLYDGTERIRFGFSSPGIWNKNFEIPNYEERLKYSYNPEFQRWCYFDLGKEYILFELQEWPKSFLKEKNVKIKKSNIVSSMLVVLCEKLKKLNLLDKSLILFDSYMYQIEYFAQNPQRKEVAYDSQIFELLPDLKKYFLENRYFFTKSTIEGKMSFDAKVVLHSDVDSRFNIYYLTFGHNICINYTALENCKVIKVGNIGYVDQNLVNILFPKLDGCILRIVDRHCQRISNIVYEGQQNCEIYVKLSIATKSYIEKDRESNDYTREGHDYTADLFP